VISQAPVSEKDLVVEIGPGHGILTDQLVRRCGSVIAVELDPRLCDELRDRYADQPRVSIVEADFLRFALPRQPGYKVVGSIPYSRTAQIVRHLLEAAFPPDDAFLVMQREAAQRFAGAPFAPESLQSLLLKPWWQSEIVRHLERREFEPPPTVHSAVFWLARRGRPLIATSEADTYRRFVRSCFGQGQTVDACLRRCFTRHQIRRLSRDLRFEIAGTPSALSFDQWLALFRFSRLIHGAHPSEKPPRLQ
jgi:23S rRNA (adenine-N6)-dimethyltransferase